MLRGSLISVYKYVILTSKTSFVIMNSTNIKCIIIRIMLISVKIAKSLD
jgi:hypothetical protein